MDFADMLDQKLSQLADFPLLRANSGKSDKSMRATSKQRVGSSSLPGRATFHPIKCGFLKGSRKRRFSGCRPCYRFATFSLEKSCPRTAPKSCDELQSGSHICRGDRHGNRNTIERRT